MASPPDGSGPLAPPPVTVTFMVILITFFILGMLSICFCRCCSQHLWNGHQANAAGGSAARNGLDPMVIRSFPTLVYSNVKHLRRENYELECAICLLEFEGESVLRLLTACYHVFHQECIDLWLESHKSCPVCRGNLDLSPEKIQDKFPAALHENNNMPDIQEHSETFFEDAISIEIEDDKEEKGMRSSERTATTSTVPGSMDKLPRWNSTGHSIVKDRSSGCRYTLRLPDNVRVRVSKGHSGSCITFGGLGVRSHVAFDELPGCSKGKGSIG